MADPGELWRRVVFLFRRRQMERDLADEMRDHLERKAANYAAAGMNPADALHAAKRQLGNAALQQELSRASWGFPTLESIWQDVRYGLRGLRQSLGFSTVAILTLALGIGATTAIFSIVNTILLRPLPYQDSERIVTLRSSTPIFFNAEIGISKPNFDDVKAQAHSFESMVLCEQASMTLTGKGEPEKLSGALVSPNFLAFFGAHPEIGRDLQPEDELARNSNVIVITHGLWQRKLGGDPNIAGKSLILDQKAYTVVGVLPAKFEPQGEFYAPSKLDDEMAEERRIPGLWAYAKLNQGTTLQTAQPELDTLTARLAAQYPAENGGMHIKAHSLQEDTVASAKRGLSILLGAVGFLLAIACANVSNLILARGARRQKEICIRAALGASRTRIARQLLIESLLVAMLGGAAGLWIAVLGIRAFKTSAPPDLPRLSELQFEPAIAWFAFLLSSLSGVLCGLAPALHTSRSEPNFTLALEGRVRATLLRSSSGSRLRSLLVVSEVALALVLLTGSALMAKSLIRTLHIDTGFPTEQLLTAHVDLPETRYASQAAKQEFIRRLRDELAARRELGQSSLSDQGMLNNTEVSQIFEPKTLGLDQKTTTLFFRAVDTNYFATLRIPLVSGRAFDDHDLDATPVVIVNESLARRFFPGQNAVGKILQLGTGPDVPHQIIGIAGDVRDIRLKSEPSPEYYVPLLKSGGMGGIHIYLRTHGTNPESMAMALQQVVWKVDKDLPVSHVESMATTIARHVAEPRLHTWLLSTFAAAGLSLTLIGIYGVISFSVAQRTQEIGIRMALGAERTNVLQLVLGQGLRLTLLGTAVGLAATFILGRLIASSLFEVRPNDPATLAGTALLMLAVAMLASYIPARRATRVDPIAALREG